MKKGKSGTKADATRRMIIGTISFRNNEFYNYGVANEEEINGLLLTASEKFHCEYNGGDGYIQFYLVNDEHPRNVMSYTDAHKIFIEAIEKYHILRIAKAHKAPCYGFYGSTPTPKTQD